MARTWRDLFILDIPPPPPPDGDEDAGEQRGGFFRRLRENLSKSREALGAELQSSVFQNLDGEAWERLEETLIYADVGASTASVTTTRCRRAQTTISTRPSSNATTHPSIGV